MKFHLHHIYLKTIFFQFHGESIAVRSKKNATPVCSEKVCPFKIENILTKPGMCISQTNKKNW